MLKNIIVFFLNTLFLSVVWIITKYLIKYVNEGAETTDLIRYLCFYVSRNIGVLYGLFTIVTIIYLIHILLFRILLLLYHSAVALVGLYTGILLALFVFILTNTLVMVRPTLTDMNYWFEILLAFSIGLILPYSEKWFKRMLSRQDKNLG